MTRAESEKQNDEKNEEGKNTEETNAEQFIISKKCCNCCYKNWCGNCWDRLIWFLMEIVPIFFHNIDICTDVLYYIETDTYNDDI